MLSRKLSTDNVTNYNEKQGTFDGINLRIVAHNHGGHQLQLAFVRVPTRFARLVIGYPRKPLGAVDCHEVRDASPPYILIKKATRAEVSSDTELFFAVDFPFDCGKGLQKFSVMRKIFW
jgi:hypothetical protein